MKIRVIWELNGYIYKLRNISGMICIKMFRIQCDICRMLNMWFIFKKLLKNCIKFLFNFNGIMFDLIL